MYFSAKLSFLLLVAGIILITYSCRDSRKISTGITKTEHIKKTAKGKRVAPVIDIMHQITMFHDIAAVRKEMTLLKQIGFDRVYFVICNPGYPAQSDPRVSITPIDQHSPIRTLESIIKLGDPNWVYMNEAKKQGLEPWAVIKPYESGTGITIPDGTKAPVSLAHVKTIGGSHIYFDNLISERPELRVKRIPMPDSLKSRLKEPVTSMEISFCLDSFTQKTGKDRFMEFKGSKQTSIDTARLDLWVSRDNGTYVKWGQKKLQTSIEYRYIYDANNVLLYKNKKRHLVVRIKNLYITNEFKYFAITLDKKPGLYTIPYSMIKAYCQAGEIPLTIGLHSRTPLDTTQKMVPPDQRIWGKEGKTAKGDNAKAFFPDMGFEFEWYGVGFWGDGWENNTVFGMARGKREYMKGTPCEAYPEVREYWLEMVRNAISMGYEGVDFRLQNHSSMVPDYFNYGYNEPIIDRYKEKYGINILEQKADPLKIMEIRGEYYYAFLKEAAEYIHSKGKKVQVHLRNANEKPVLSSDFNELGFWAMPKIQIDWKKAIDLADEITVKDYYLGSYDPLLAHDIKAYANKQNKRVWIIDNMGAQKELEKEFLDATQNDATTGGVMLYEFSSGLFTSYFDNPDNDNTKINKVKTLLKRFQFK